MHAYLALAFSLAAATLAEPQDRLGYQREIDSNRNPVPKFLGYVLTNEYLGSQKNKAKLITRLRPDDPIVADNVILESNVVRVVKPAKREVANEEGPELVRQRRGYNLENVRVPARYPYLPVPSYSRSRRWG